MRNFACSRTLLLLSLLSFTTLAQTAALVGCERTPSANTGGTKSPEPNTPDAKASGSNAAPAVPSAPADPNDPRWSEPQQVRTSSTRGLFICPMFCENDYVTGPKTHDTKTTCSICRMDLEPVAELNYDVRFHPAKPDANGRAAFASGGVLFRFEVSDPLGVPVKPDTYAPMFGTVSVRASDDSWKGDAQAATLTTQEGKLMLKLVVPKAGRYLVSGTLTPPTESGREPGEFLAPMSIE